jgi:hypothetical protein
MKVKSSPKEVRFLACSQPASVLVVCMAPIVLVEVRCWDVSFLDAWLAIGIVIYGLTRH